MSAIEIFRQLPRHRRQKPFVVRFVWCKTSRGSRVDIQLLKELLIRPRCWTGILAGLIGLNERTVGDWPGQGKTVSLRIVKLAVIDVDSALVQDASVRVQLANRRKNDATRIHRNR